MMNASIEQYISGFEKPKAVAKKARKLLPVEASMDDARRRAASGDWAGARGKTLVGLYALCHQMVYGILPAELEDAAMFRIASKLAAMCMHTRFDDDASGVAEMIRWSWEREKRLHTWAQSKSVDRKRLHWKWQFNRVLETDFRISLTQKRR